MSEPVPERDPTDGWLILPFRNSGAFESWLDAHQGNEPGIWLKFAKKGRGIESVSFPEATEVAACFGWIDSKMHRYDDDYYVLRYQPRRPRSNWAESSKKLAERLIAEGRMRPTGLAEVEAAKADGRWGSPVG